MRQHSYGVGQYRTSEGHQFVASRYYKPDATKRAIIVCPPRGQIALQATANGWAGTLLAALAEAGFPVLAVDCGGSTAHGNAASATAIGQARTYASTAFGAKIDQIGILATSMGALAACRYAQDSPANVGAMAFGVPNLDLEDVHDVTRTDLATEINAAHGDLAGYQAFLPAYNPIDNTADLDEIPQYVAYSSDDDQFTAGIAQTYGAAVGADVVNLGAVGHSPVSMDANAVVAFFEEHLI